MLTKLLSGALFFMEASCKIKLPMRKEQAWYLKRVIIGIVLTLCAAQFFALTLTAWERARVADSERITAKSLETSRNLLAAAADVSPYLAITASLRDTQSLLSERARGTRRIRSALRLVETVAPLGASKPTQSVLTNATLVTTADTFAWLSSAAPAISLIAGYDSRQDIAAAVNTQDLFKRLYTAHIGMSSLVPLLDAPPPAVTASDVLAIGNDLKMAIDAAAEAIRAIDSSGVADASVARFVYYSSQASTKAVAVQKRLTSEPFRESLLELLQ